MDLVGAPLGYQKITGLSVAKGLTVPTGASRALIQPTSHAIVFRDDGTVPDATTGITLSALQTMTIYGAELQAIRFIEDTPSTTLHVLYYT